MDYVDTGIADGATVVCGGRRHGQTGYFVEPTIFVDVKSDARIMREEIFGPVLVATPFTDLGRCGAPGQRHTLRPGRQYLDQRPVARASDRRAATGGHGVDQHPWDHWTQAPHSEV